MSMALDPNKTKIAKRMIEVFEFFSAENREATVMDIVKRYGRPQSSTSELMSALADMGLLYKNPYSRSYLPTPRMAALGSAAQPELIGSGQLFGFMDRLAAAGRYSVALFGMVGPHLQIFRHSAGSEAVHPELECGASLPLSDSAAGLLLLSTLGADQAQRTLWRINAEAEADNKLDLPAMNEFIRQIGSVGYATGSAGFAAEARVTAVLVPTTKSERPLALGVIYKAGAAVDPETLVATLNHGLGKIGLADMAATASPLRNMFAM